MSTAIDPFVNLPRVRLGGTVPPSDVPLAGGHHAASRMMHDYDSRSRGGLVLNAFDIPMRLGSVTTGDASPIAQRLATANRAYVVHVACGDCGSELVVVINYSAKPCPWHIVAYELDQAGRWAEAPVPRDIYDGFMTAEGSPPAWIARVQPTWCNGKPVDR